jgi:hypothetical protein
MAITSQEKAQIFEKELELIFDKSIREFTKLCIMSAPDYAFFDCPSSSSGKHHPVDELCGQGNIIHSKKVFTVAYDLCRGLGCEDDRDSILSACLLHDLVKQGFKKTGHTVSNHPALSGKLVDQVQEDTQILDETTYLKIRGCTIFHYGLWTENSYKKPLSKYTMPELCVYLSDYVASKKSLDVKYKR